MDGLRVRCVAATETNLVSPAAEAQTLLSGLLQSPTLKASLDPADFRSLESLRVESDPALLYEGLLHLGIHFEQADRLEVAATIFSGLSERPLGTVSQRARAHLDAIQGRGSLGARAEFLLRRLSREASDPAMLVGMAGAQAIFSIARAALLSRLAASPTANFLTRGFGARALASVGAFSLEAPSFVAFTRVANAALGREQDWSGTALRREIAGSYLTLGALKLSGWGTGLAMPRSQSWSAGLYRQAGIWGGIYLGHSLETRLGLRPQVDGATTLVDSLAMLLQFHVSGRLLQETLPGMEGLNRDLVLRSELLASAPSKNSNLGPFGASPALAVAEQGALPERPVSPSLDNVLMSAQAPGDPMRALRPSSLPDRASTLRPVQEAAPEAPAARPPIPVATFRFPSLPESCLCLVIEYLGETHGPRLPDSLTSGIREGLASNPNLEEVRLRFSDGSILFFHRGENGSIEENREESAQARALEAWNLYPATRSLTLRLIAPWPGEAPKTTLHEFLRDLRKQSGLTQLQVAEQVQAITGEAKDYNSIRRYETNSGASIAFPTLRALAEIYGIDVRTLIQLSNQSRFPDLPERRWTTRDYPIYLENSADLQRVSYFAEQDPRRKGFGWLVYSSRKNPFHYHTTMDLAAVTDLHANAFGRLEMEKNPPSQRAIQGLNQALAIPVGELIRRSNRTFFPDLDVTGLFPGQEIFIDSLADDPRKIRAYAAEPGTLGQSLFAYRKTLPERPGTVALSRRLGHHDNFWGDRELNKAPIDATNWRSWFDLLTRVGLSTQPLSDFLGDNAAESPKASVLFHQALQGEAVENFANRTGFDRKGLGLLLNSGSRLVQPETILDLRRALPALKGDLFYRALRPEFINFFPEAERPSPELRITREQIAEAMALTLGDALYKHRMDHGMELTEAGDLLGVSDNTIKTYESIWTQIENPEVLKRAAHLLALDHRVVYLHYHPQVLRLFRLSSGEMNEAEYRYWIQERASVRDPGNLRERLYAAARDAGIADAAGLAERMGISSGLARKYWQKIQPLTVDEIRSLTQTFPTLSYREWYEHFQGHALSYFLGRGMEGEVDYSLPAGWDRRTYLDWDLRGEIRRAIEAQYPSPQDAAVAAGVSFLNAPDNLTRSLKQRSWTNDTIARVARTLGIDRRALYFYFRTEELRPMLEPQP